MSFAVATMIHPHLDRLLVLAHEMGASDLHIVAGVPPAFRSTGEIILADEDVLLADECNAMAASLLSELQQHKFDRDWDLCISIRHEVAGRIRGLPIYLVHGALDWMFPVEIARQAHRTLQAAGANVVYREIDDLSHTYPREINAPMLDWLRGG